MKNPALAPAVPVEGLNLRDVSRFLHGFRESL